MCLVDERIDTRRIGERESGKRWREDKKERLGGGGGGGGEGERERERD